MTVLAGATDDLVAPVIAAVAGHGLPAAAGHGLGVGPLDDRSWPRLLAEVARERLGGLLLAAIDDGTVPVTDGQRSQAVELHRESMVVALGLEQALLSLLDRFTASGIETRVLKGAAHAHLLYPDPALRSFGDVDLLVRGDDLPDAVRLLQDDGGRRRFPEPRRGFDRRFTKGVCVVMPSGHEVDLHRTLATGPFGLRVDAPALFERPESFALAGRQVLALAAEERFLHACYHAVLGSTPPRLVPLRDVAQAMTIGGLDADRVLALASRWGGEVVVARAVSEVATHFGVGGGTLGAWSAERPITATEARALAAYDGTTRSSAAQALAGLRAVSGLRPRLEYGLALALPTEAVRPTLQRWWRGVRTIRTGWRP